MEFAPDPFDTKVLNMLENGPELSGARGLNRTPIPNFQFAYLPPPVSPTVTQYVAWAPVDDPS